MRKLLFAVAVGILVAAAVFVPLPLLALTPGPVVEADEGIELSSADDVDEVDGDLLLTTVRLESPTTIETAAILADPERELVARRRVAPPGVDLDEFARRQERIFRESMRVAAAVGQRAAGYEVTVQGDGATVVTVLPGAPAEDVLENGDVITAVDGDRVELASELPAGFAAHRSGDTVTLTIERDDEERDVEVELGSVERLERPGVGVAVQTRNRRIDLPVDVEVDVGRVGGPSAGLLAALTVYDMLDDGDLLSGRTVAGTGTIDPSGRVGPVGGVTQKVAAAIDAGASVFLVPASQGDGARDAAAGQLEVAPVDTFDEALDRLRADGG